MKRFLNVAIVVGLLILFASLIWCIWDLANHELVKKIIATILIVFAWEVYHE